MKFPKYIITADGFIGTLYGIEDEEFPCYRFDRGFRIADNWEVENGTDDYNEAVKISEKRRAERKH